MTDFNNNIDYTLEKITQKLKLEEGKKSLKENVDSLVKKGKITMSQLIRFKNKYDYFLDEIIQIVIKKYDSDAYKKRENKIGIEPRKDLFWFLLQYAQTYGRHATKEEYKKFGNKFTICMYFYKEYFFSRMDGNIIQIYKNF